MASTPSEIFYDLALRALEEQERDLVSLRSRTGTIVAAAAIAATVLAREVFAGTQPDGWSGWTASGLGFVGLLAVLFASTYVLRSHDLLFSIDAAAALEEAVAFGSVDDEHVAEVELGMTYRLSSMRAENDTKIRRIRTAFATALGGLLVETVGLGVGAALA
jgi:hypothetical protein